MTTTIITAILGCSSGVLAGILAYIKFFAERRDKKKAETLEALFDKKLAPVIERQDKIVERLDKIESHNEGQDAEIHDIRLDTTRTQLYFKMEHDTHNHDTILKIAHKYFVILKGDWVATIDFLAWAEKENVKIPKPILDAIAQNDSKK